MFLKSLDADLFVSECGPVGGNTIVAHGGWVGSGELWMQPFEALSKTWRCITYDHRGTGATRHRGTPITPGMMVDDLFRVLDSLQVERCVLAGESAGGLTVLQAARRAPERFSGLVLVGARYEGSLSAGAKRLVDGCKHDFPATMRRFVDACIPEPDCEAERDWCFKIVMRSSAQHAVELLEGLAGIDLAGDLEQIHVPALLLHGVEDVIRPPMDSEFMQSRMPSSRLVKLEGVGHVPTVTRPARVAAEIEAFFR